MWYDTISTVWKVLRMSNILHDVIFFGKPDTSRVWWDDGSDKDTYVEKLTKQFVYDQKMVNEILQVNEIVKSNWVVSDNFYHTYHHAVDVFMAMILILHNTKCCEDQEYISQMLICALIHDYKYPNFEIKHYSKEEYSMRKILEDGLSYHWFSKCYDIVTRATMSKIIGIENSDKNISNIFKLLAADLFSSCCVSFSTTLKKSLLLKNELSVSGNDLTYDDIMNFLRISMGFSSKNHINRAKSIYEQLENEKQRAEDFLNGISLYP